MSWDDDRLRYWQRLVNVRQRRFYRMLLGDMPGWTEALRQYHRAGDGYLRFLQGVG